VGNTDFIVECYGIRELFADFDAGREYWRETDTGGVVASALEELATFRFREFFDEAGLKFFSAYHFRQRHLILAIQNREQRGFF
jgi:hypothetical protein